MYYVFVLNLKRIALAGVAQWIEGQPAKQGVTGLIPSQGMCLGCWQGPQVGGQAGHVRGNQLTFLSLSASLPL